MNIIKSLDLWSDDQNSIAVSKITFYNDTFSSAVLCLFPGDLKEIFFWTNLFLFLFSFVRKLLYVLGSIFEKRLGYFRVGKKEGGGGIERFILRYKRNSFVWVWKNEGNTIWCRYEMVKWYFGICSHKHIYKKYNIKENGIGIGKTGMHVFHFLYFL